MNLMMSSMLQHRYLGKSHALLASNAGYGDALGTTNLSGGVINETPLASQPLTTGPNPSRHLIV